ncbi:protein SPT2 homolog [Pristis pectinata]|uniref:protein SPT2 homolog n=1 Tax=Pristis pectinata TaxID=685728 RepID=UPI00223CE889|nr:protein SPT2 homolog [Pristis pectinata]
MDFGSIISRASENQVDVQVRKRYSLSVKPPKKHEQVKGVRSAAVQAFLKRKEEELRKKDLEDRRRKEELIAKRVALKHDRKARAMATRTKDNFRGYDGIPVDQKGKKRTSDDEGKEQRMDDSNEDYYDREQAEDGMSEAEDTDGSEEFVEHWDERSSKRHYREPEVTVKQLKRQHREPEKPFKEPKRLYKEPDEVAKVPEQAYNKAKKSHVPKKPPMNFTDLLKLAEKKQFEPVELKPIKKVEEKLHTAEELKELEFLERKRQKQNDKMKSEKVVTVLHPPSSSKKEPSIKGNKSTNLAQGSGERNALSRENSSTSVHSISKKPKMSSSERLPPMASHKAPAQEKSKSSLGSGYSTSKVSGNSSGKTAINVSAKSRNSSQTPSKGLKPGSNGSHSALSSKHTQKKINRPTSSGKVDNVSTRHERTGSSNLLHSRSASSSAPERPKVSCGISQKQASSASKLDQPQSSNTSQARPSSVSNSRPSRAGASDSTRPKERGSSGTPRPNSGSLQSKSTNAPGSIRLSSTGSMRPGTTSAVPGRHGSTPSSGAGRPGGGATESKPKCTVVSETISSKNFPSRPSNGQMINRRPPPTGYRPMMRPPGHPARPPGPISYKRRLDDDDEEEYDPEMDDFIDDAGESQDEISKHIREIFGYDRTKYKDESDYALRFIESSWKEQQKEEAKSLRLGIMEDAEEMRKEEELKKRAKAKKQKL